MPTSYLPKRRNRVLLIACLAVMAAILATGWLTRTTWLPSMLDFLDVTEAPHNADYAVILGAGKNRTRKAIDLYQGNVVSKVMICGFYPDKLQFQIDLLWAAGLPESDVVINIGGSNTWQEAKRVLKILTEQGAHSALIVTDAYHTRRARATYAHLQQNPAIQLSFVAAYATVTPDTWWQKPRSRSPVLREYLKLAYYLVRYGVWAL